MSRIITILFYNLLFITPLEFILKLFGRFHKKIGKGLKVRKGWEISLRKQLKTVPKGERALFHVASAGELQQALPVIRQLKAANPSWVFGISFYSISGYSFFKGDDAVDFITYMPFDSPRNAMSFMSIIAPSLYVVVAYDAWLNHCMAAKNIGAKLYLIGGILSPRSSRTRFPLRSITIQTMLLFEKIFCISEEDKNQFITLVDPSNVVVAGEPRYDHIIEGIKNASEKLKRTTLPLWDTEKIMTLGSVWTEGWQVINEALLTEVSQDALKLFVAPHEMHESFLEEIEKACEEKDIRIKRYSQLETVSESESLQVIIIDTIGLLSALYSRSSLAYVGGAFGKGVHNIAEPAAFGLPLYFGENYVHSLEARNAVESSAAIVVEDCEQFGNDLTMILNDSELFTRRSEKSQAVIHGAAGATSIICESFLDEGVFDTLDI